MDAVAFELADSGVGSEIRIKVNGRLLQDLARDVEHQHALAEGDASLAGSYAGLSPSDIRGSTRHFLGRPQAVWFEDGDTVLLGCGCGEWGCWPLSAVVEVDDEHVRWSEFRNGHRDWDLRGLGPFVFARSQYVAALSSMELAE